MTDTNQYLLSSGITPVGYGDTSPQSCQPVLIKKRKDRSGTLQLRCTSFGKLGISGKQPRYLSAADRGTERRNHKLQTAESQKLHSRYSSLGSRISAPPYPCPRKGAHSLIRAGADAIIGHHPHIIQKEEYYDGKPIFYSLGNFVFDQHNRKLRKV